MFLHSYFFRILLLIFQFITFSSKFQPSLSVYKNFKNLILLLLTPFLYPIKIYIIQIQAENKDFLLEIL